MRNSDLLLIHHSASRQHAYPPNSPEAIRVCLEAGARAIEVDISLLADGRFSLLHGPLLERETTGSGLVGSHTGEQLRTQYYIWQGEVTAIPVGLLSDAIDLLRQHPHSVELQLDLKPDVFHSNEILSQLAADLQSVKDRVRVTSPADWALRRLRAIDPDLPLGFDPLLYLEPDSDEAPDPALPPFRMGAFGYYDDHPLATRRWGETAAYLAARAEVLWSQVPFDAVWYIHAGLLARALDEGFDWIADLHQRGAQVDAWTLDPDRQGHVALAQRLARQGVDRITTNDAQGLAQAMGTQILY